MSEPSKTSIVVGVLLASDSCIQLIDVSAVDLIAMMDTKYLTAVSKPGSAAPSQGLDVTIHYISEKGDQPFPTTGGASLVVTHSIENSPALDVLLIPGGPPNHETSDAMGAFIRRQAEGAIAVLSVCTGCFPLAQSGWLAQKAATAPLPLLPTVQSAFRDTAWEPRRWVRHGKTWSSGSVVNGLDMVAAWMASYFADRQLALHTVLAVADVAQRAVAYPEEMLKNIAAAGSTG